MDTESKMKMNKWSVVTLKWVNSLQEASCHFTSLSQARDSALFVNLLKNVYESSKKKIPDFTNSEHLAYEFVKEYFSEDLLEHLDTVNTTHEENWLIMWSLLMYTTCIQCQIEDVLLKNCRNIDDSTQRVLKKFFKKMIQVGDGNFTSKKIFDAIHLSLGSSTELPQSFQSPTPTSLQKLFYSPLARINFNTVNKISTLKSEIEDLIFERNDLLKKNDHLEGERKNQKTLLKKNTREIEKLKEENEKLSQEFSERNKQNEYQSKLLLKENKKLIKELKEFESQLEVINKKLDAVNSKNWKLKEENSSLKNSLEISQRDCEDYSIKLTKLNNENLGLKLNIEELKIVIEVYQEQAQPEEVLNVSCPPDEENLGKTVVELQLYEKQEQIEKLEESHRTTIEQQKRSLKNLKSQVQKLESELEFLRNKNESFAEAQKSLNEEIENYKQKVTTNDDNLRKLTMDSAWKDNVLEALQAERTSQHNKFMEQNHATRKRRSRSFENLDFKDLQHHVGEASSTSLHHSGRTLSTGMGNVFPSEDEAEEDNIEEGPGDCDTASLLSDRKRRKKQPKIFKKRAAPNSIKVLQNFFKPMVKTETVPKSAYRELNDGPKKT